MKRCYVFDIDGTVADGAHRLHHIQKEPKDWRGFFAAVGGDAPIPHIVDLIRDLIQVGRKVVYVSGRSDECREATVDWLHAQALPSSSLYMRPAGDHRDDALLKVELLAKVRADGYEPIMAFDDRNRVVAAWRAAGVPCAQVAEGDF